MITRFSALKAVLLVNLCFFPHFEESKKAALDKLWRRETLSGIARQESVLIAPAVLSNLSAACGGTCFVKRAKALERGACGQHEEGGACARHSRFSARGARSSGAARARAGARRQHGFESGRSNGTRCARVILRGAAPKDKKARARRDVFKKKHSQIAKQDALAKHVISSLPDVSQIPDAQWPGWAPVLRELDVPAAAAAVRRVSACVCVCVC